MYVIPPKLNSTENVDDEVQTIGNGCVETYY